MAVAAIIVGAVVAAAAAGYGAYATDQAIQQQAKQDKNASDQASEAEHQAAEAAAARIRYNAEQKRRGFLSREAGSGAEVGTGSLLEEEGRFAYNTELNAQEAMYPHKVKAQQYSYQSELFDFKRRQASGRNELNDIGIAMATSSAKSYAASLTRNSKDPGATSSLAAGTPEANTSSGNGIVANA